MLNNPHFLAFYWELRLKIGKTYKNHPYQNVKKNNKTEITKYSVGFRTTTQLHWLYVQF